LNHDINNKDAPQNEPNNIDENINNNDQLNNKLSSDIQPYKNSDDSTTLNNSNTYTNNLNNHKSNKRTLDMDNNINNKNARDINVPTPQILMKRHGSPLIKESSKKRDINLSIQSIELDNPLSFNQAITCKNKEKWIEAIKEELNNLYRNKTMIFIRHIPNNKSVITTKWVFATKRDKNNNISKYKACLVARGFTQKNGTVKM